MNKIVRGLLIELSSALLSVLLIKIKSMSDKTSRKGNPCDKDPY